jgi:hypothetical protein
VVINSLQQIVESYKSAGGAGIQAFFGAAS